MDKDTIDTINFEQALKSLDRVALGTLRVALIRRITEIGINEGMSVHEATKAIQARVSLSREAVEELERLLSKSETNIISIEGRKRK